MMVDELILASNNEHKRREIARLFPGIRVVLAREAGMELDFEENGSTFLENALGKALVLFRHAGRPVIADDSGLCVDALGGAPGLMSNRFGAAAGGQPLDTPRRNALLLERMEGVRARGAHFVCCLVLVLGEDRFIAAQETVHGEIAPGPRGTNGFGYDPLFALPGRGLTLAEIPDAEKDEISHRGRAARRVLSALRADH
jgi:XTP/dITP diphosphohydrolase